MRHGNIPGRTWVVITSPRDGVRLLVDVAEIRKTHDFAIPDSDTLDARLLGSCCSAYKECLESIKRTITLLTL